MAGVKRDTGEEIGGYTVVETLGQGGSGAVYRVRDGGGETYALKLVDAQHDEVAARRLEREVQALQSLRHPAVPRILDAELDGAETFVVFEYIPGVSIWQHVQDHGPLSGPALADFADRTASALEAVHEAGVVHRDVTPSNIMVGPEGPVLIDFGLSHLEHDERLTRDGLVSGTAGYVAPEVIDGAEPGPIADRWSWAATVAYALTGSAPFGSGTGAISRTLAAQVELPDAPGAEALRAALGRDIGARPSPREVVAALRGATIALPASGEQMAATEVAPGLAATSVMPANGAWNEAGSDPTAGLTVTAASPVSSDELRRRDAADPWDTADDGEAGDVDYADDGEGDYEDDGEDGAAHERDPWAADDASLPSAPRHPLMTLAWMLALAASAALAPFIAAAALVLAAVLARTAQRRAVGLQLARRRHGQRRGDAAIHALGLPWHLLRSLGETLPAAVLAVAAGGGVAALCWWLVDEGRFAGGGLEDWGHAGALAAGGLVAAATLWWGPWMEATREGGRRVASALAPTRGVAVAWTLVGLAALGVVVLAVYLNASPQWWPAPQLLG
ncbi:serine/threonine-protein kinase [Demequina sp. SO4-13]|uniref:serine/threonine-protein kinase n=1 Tax=Demequina sp. SO4-13 TaxID=3401027 RepID=UPI003AF87D8C